MANHLNWGGAFGGASAALGQAVNVSAAKDIEDMRSTRAENLARFTLAKQEEHEDWRAKLAANTQEAIGKRAADTQNAIFDRDVKIRGMENDQADKKLKMWDKISQDRTQAAEDRVRLENSARQSEQDRRAAAMLRVQMNDKAWEIDKQRTTIGWQMGQMRKDPLLGTDPDLLAKALEPLQKELVDLDQSKASMMRDFHMALAGYGDKDFAGVSAPPPQSAAAPRAPASPYDYTQGTRTPNNPLDHQIPGLGDGPNPADNEPAVDPYGGASGSGMPVISGTQRPPTSTRVGPLVSPQIGMPSLMPGVGGGPPDAMSSGGLSPFQKPPSAASSLIPGT